MRWTPYELWEKVKLVHCGLDQHYLQGDAPSPVLASRLVCVGRLCIEKAQPVLIQAVSRLRDEGVPCDVVLVGDGPIRLEIESQIKRLGLEGVVRITGWATGERVKREIASARALVLPSFAENLPVVIMEAMALSRPVISTYVAGIPELVRPGETGWLVPPGDVEALAEALREALAVPVETIAAMGKAARERVAERHDVMREAVKLKEYFAGEVEAPTIATICPSSVSGDSPHVDSQLKDDEVTVTANRPS